MTWPPKHLAVVTPKLAEWDAWLSGDRGRLEAANAANVQGLGAKLRRAWRRFWGAPVTDLTAEPKIKVHVPLAADIARASADLMFASPPAITSEHEPTAERLQKYLDESFIDTCAAAAEISAGLGGVFLRVVWDTETERAFITRMDADWADPIFSFGELVSVKFTRTVKTKDSQVWRHQEEHKIVDGTGVVIHHLYQGTVSELGRQVPLTDLDETASLAVLLTENGDEVSSRSPGLTAVYLPNRTPNTLWRNDPVGANLGLPDVEGAEDLLDRLDHAYSALLREVDLSKARLIVPEWMLDVLPSGQGAVLDSDREIWSPLAIPNNDGTPYRPELVQPDIRVDKYLAVMQQLTEDILRHAGYSASTVGEDEDGAQTATEVKDKAGRSGLTRGRKIRVWQPALVQILSKMLAVEQAYGWATDVDPETVSVVFPEATKTTALENAQTVQLLDAARAISTYRKVQLANPEWDDVQIQAEVDLILAEKAVPDPEGFGIGGAGLSFGG